MEDGFIRIEEVIEEVFGIYTCVFYNILGIMG